MAETSVAALDGVAAGVSPLPWPAFAELGGDAVMRDRLLRAHFFNPVSQFSTTVMGEGAISVASVLNRKRFPSAATSYL
jgi:hypothetical protein